jgi:hypothetical protein
MQLPVLTMVCGHSRSTAWMQLTTFVVVRSSSPLFTVHDGRLTELWRNCAIATKINWGRGLGLDLTDEPATLDSSSASAALDVP